MVLSRLPILSIFRPKHGSVSQSDQEKALDYINEYWDELLRHHPEDKGTLIGLPYPYLIPAAKSKNCFQFEEQYYWDSYFTALGLTEPEHQVLVEGMLENLIYLFNRFKVIPNASRMYFTSRSQPPLLTTFIFHIFDTYHKSNDWLEERIEVAKTEYQSVWMNNQHPQWHRVHRDLSRYYDVNMLHDLAEAESGWDMTPRFERKALDFLPVDLNSLLYKYETDFARAAEILSKNKEAESWQAKAKHRKRAMNDLMWGKLRGFYFDFNYERKVLGDIWSLAGYFTMWTGLASAEQAAKMVANLDKFEKIGGLSTTSRPLIDTNALFGSLPAQWAYPNGWAPLQYIVVEGLKRYGYEAEAKRIAQKWVKTNLSWFKAHKNFLEKYNVVNIRKKPVDGVYPLQTGFGWTNAVLVRFIKDFDL